VSGNTITQVLEKKEKNFYSAKKYFKRLVVKVVEIMSIQITCFAKLYQSLGNDKRKTPMKTNR
jgi:hypothetical protein